MEDSLVMANCLRQAMNHDPTVHCCQRYVYLFNWDGHLVQQELKPYFDRQLELSTEQGCLMWGISSLRAALEGVSGVTLWSPGYRKNEDIMLATQGCTGCQHKQQNPKLTPVHQWEYPKGPWRQISMQVQIGLTNNKRR